MSKQQAQELVENTLHNDFDKEKFVYFAKNLLNKIDETKIFKYTGAYIAEAFRPFVKSYERIGQYIDPENNKIDILIVYLQKEASLERARTAQRNFVARYLKDRGEKDAGLVAFVSPDPADWRFSLVKMEYKFTESKSGKAKVKEEFTPAKRWSFLVGKHEDSHTAQSRLAPVIDDDQNNPTLKQLEDAFNIEKVTKEFFEKYRELFLRVHETLNGVIERHPDIKADFTEKNVNTADFSKKLLGQIVFLYFLQKKGWFGVPMDKGWGEGDKKFLRTRFEEASGKDQNYFNDYLEPLFYEALAKERDGDFYSRFECKIPFLNGGLFDPINNYDWVNTTIDLPNELFSNRIKNQKTGDIGNGILDIFDRYNFTVKEDEPLEKEVAVDPEMLGKVFENLLEVKDRKSKGTYYTPREIVNYMCEQSLLNYLATELEGKVSKEDLEKLIKSGENVVEHEVVSVSKEDNPEYSGGYKRLLPDTIKESAKEIDEKLSTIKVCDPAIGSGAFPVGMMNAIVKTRVVLSSYLKDNNRTLYTFKRDCIQNSLYGVDIDPGAVEIAKLRLWLSLVVDEDDIKQIKPLPNLDYKIMQGNSLLEEFEGIKLFDEKLIAVPDVGKEKQIEALKQKQDILQKEYIELHKQNKLTPAKQTELDSESKKLLTQIRRLSQSEKVTTEDTSLFDVYSEAKRKANELKRLHREFFEATQKSKKDEIKKQIERLEWELIEATLKEQNKVSALKKLEEFKRSNTKPFFLWKLNFAEVFEENGGFDVVIANPPYFQLQKNKKVSEELSAQSYKTYSKSSDIYCIFYEKGISLLKNNGTLTYISSNSWLQTKYGVLLRRYLAENTNPLMLINFENSQLFDTAIVETNVLILQKGIFLKDLKVFNLNESLELHSIDDLFKQNYTSINDLDDSGWIIGKNEDSLIRKKMEYRSVRLKDLKQKIYIGILNGYNNAFIIDEQTKQRLVQEDPKSAEIINPILRGRDVGKYNYAWQNLWLINTHNGIKGKISRIDAENDYPAIYRYLQMFEKQLRIRLNKGDHWTNLRSCGYFQEFTKPKIIWGELSDRPKFAYDDKGFYAEATLFALIGDNLKYLLGVFNSKLGSWYFGQISTSSGMGTSRWKKYKIELLPIKDPDTINTDEIVNFVNEIISITQTGGYNTNSEKQAKVRDLEHQIDELVYRLYGLTEEEIKVVEES